MRHTRTLMLLATLLALPMTAMAASVMDPSTTVAIEYSKEVYCGARDILASNLGLMLGFILAATGLYSMITKGVSAGALATIIAGALLTSLPGIIENFLSGTQKILGSLTTTKTFIVPSCSGGGGPTH